MKQVQQNNSSENLYKGLKLIAHHLLEDDEKFLCLWWSKKYSLPQNHPLLLSLTFEELLIEFLIDQHIKEKEGNKTELPEDIRKFDADWDTSEEHDKKMKEKFKKFQEVDLSKYQKQSSASLEPEEISETF